MSKRQLERGVVGMNRIREVLRFRELGLSQREIHKATGLARSTVQEYLGLAEARGITHEKAVSLSDSELREVLGRKTPGRQAQCPDPDFEYIHKELHSRKGVTLELLWEEWLETEKNGYSYSIFCRRYRSWATVKKVVLRNAYQGGEFGLCDYAGETLSWFDECGEYRAEIFVGVLGASNYTYAEATESQQLSLGGVEYPFSGVLSAESRGSGSRFQFLGLRRPRTTKTLDNPTHLFDFLVDEGASSDRSCRPPPRLHGRLHQSIHV